ncbi:hypothetical protein LZ30DRAFT_56716 [Colletotrichum cereale]|nr:hypothetical protein LZ30DRAFT_56716 [Colletotrichum cereale]
MPNAADCRPVILSACYLIRLTHLCRQLKTETFVVLRQGIVASFPPCSLICATHLRTAVGMPPTRRTLSVQPLRTLRGEGRESSWLLTPTDETIQGGDVCGDDILWLESVHSEPAVTPAADHRFNRNTSRLSGGGMPRRSPTISGSVEKIDPKSSGDDPWSLSFPEAVLTSRLRAFYRVACVHLSFLLFTATFSDMALNEDANRDSCDGMGYSLPRETKREIN